MYVVSITDAKGAPVNIDVVYRGASYDEAITASLEARGNRLWRGRWIRFYDAELDVVKWAQVF